MQELKCPSHYLIHYITFIPPGAHKGKEHSTAHIHMELSKTKLHHLACFKNFHIRKFLDSCTANLTSRTATADSASAEGTPCRCCRPAPKRKSTKQRRKSKATAHVQEKPKVERRLSNKNVKRVCKELDKVDVRNELLWDVSSHVDSCYHTAFFKE